MTRVRLQPWLIVTCMLAVLLAASVSVAQTSTGRYATDEFIIKFNTHATASAKNFILSDIGAINMKELSRIQAQHGQMQELSVDDAIARWQNHPDVEYIEPNWELTMDEVPNDPMFQDLWGMQNTGQTGGTAGADISATTAWDVFTGSSNVVIAVIDTGVDYNHPDLAANIWTNPGEIAGNGIDDDGNGYIDDIHGWDFINGDNDPMDDNGHGTHCSGTIGAVGDNDIGVAGVNWNVSIMGLKFLSAGGSGSTSDAVSCLEYATMMGVRITSNSYGGGGFSQALYDAIEDAQANGALFIAAAGNSASDNDATPHYPSSYDLDNVIAVANTTHNDALSSLSCWGLTSVDLAAPGTDILSTLPGSSYGSLSGTSMSTPHVAGAVGLVMGRFPAIGAADAKSLIMNLADPIPALDGLMVSGARLNAFMPIADPDSIPPAQITDLMVTSTGSNWMDLQWTAVGDDGFDGTASRYDVRYATFPLDDFNWDTATPVNGAPDPADSGMPESMRLDGLDFDTSYYVGVKAVDEFGNAAPASNSPMGTTLGAPDIATTPTFMGTALLTGETRGQSLTLHNEGLGTLDYDIPAPYLQGAAVTSYAYEEVAKGGDFRIGDPVIDDAGGPDSFGYRWVDSNDPLGPVYDWVDISAFGNVAMSSGDDSNVGPFPMSFTFPFYGGDYSEFRVCSNGFVSLTSSSTAYGNQRLPSAGAPAHLIAPFWDDLDTAPGTVYWYDDGTRVIVQWEGVSAYGGGGPYSYQAILNQDGSIVYQYDTMGAPLNSATVGIQNGSGTDGVEVAYNTDYVADGLAVRIWAVPQWLTVYPDAGTVWSGGANSLTVMYDATGLVGGTYDGTIRIFSNDPDEPMYEVPVTLDVTGAPDMAVDPTFFDFGDLFLGAMSTTQVSVRNIGTDVLTITGITLGDAAFTADQSAFALAPGATQLVNVTFDPPAVAAYSTTMEIASDDPGDPVTTVSLMGAALDPPQFAVDPTALASDLYTGENETQILTFSNSGGADFEFDLAIDFKAEVTVYEETVVLGKDDVDTRPGILGSGGPDLFGYRWIDSDEPGGPTFEWTDISATGTPVFTGTADDVNNGPFPIGFDFGFYGNTFDTFNVSSNGFLSFTSTSSDLSNSPLPGTGSPENLLAVFHDDLRIDTSTGANVFYQYMGDRLIVQWHEVPKYFSTGSLTFQAHLLPNGTIMYYYLEMVDATLTSATVGIQNATQDDGLTVVYNDAYVHDGLAVRFQAFPEWLVVNPNSGVVAPGGNLPVEARFNASGLFGGTYEADIVINSNDPSVPSLPIPVVLTVTGAPQLQVSATSFDFGNVFLGTPTLQNLVVSNAGTDDLVFSGISIDNTDFNTSLTLPLTLGPTQSAVATVGFVPSVTGDRTGTLTLVSNDPVSPTMEITLAGVGLEPPIASVDPTTLAAALFTGEQETQTVDLSNTGASDLVWTAHTMLGATEVEVYADLELGKGDPDPRPGILGTGGPDLYGYRWKDSDEVGGPMFEWTDISATGTPVFSGVADDSNDGPFPVGFAFPFYGTPFTEFNVCSNGWISFTSTSTDLSNGPLPGTGAPENLLAMFHDDLRVDTGAGNNVYYQNVGNKLVVQYDQVPRYSSGGPYTFQAHLYPNGTIMYYYLSMAGDRLDEATIGIQNATQDDGLTVVYNDVYVHDNMAIRLAPVSDWITVNPADGVLPAGGVETVNVTFDAAELFGGVYEGAVLFESNDPLHGLLEVPAVLDVTGVPVLAVEPGQIDFGESYVGYSETFDIMVSNVGTDLLSVTGFTATKSDYSFDPMVFDLDPFESQVVTVTFTPGVVDDRSGSVAIASNDANSPTVVPIVGIAVDPPIVQLLPDALEGAAMPGATKVKQLKIRNPGGSDLTWSLSAADGAVSTTVQYPYLEVGKEEVDPRPGILGAGGPDDFGHNWVDSDEPGGPTFVWNDISGGIGTPVFGAYADDGNEGPFPIGFSFPFYGNDFTEFNVCSNGFLSFTSTSSPYTNQPLPSAGAPENLLAVLWDDMVVDPSDGNEVYYHFDGEKLIVQFEIRRIANYTTPFYSMQAWLYPSGNIMYMYNTLGTVTDSATIGIQNADGSDGLMATYNTAYVHDQMAILFSAIPPWLSVSLDSGTMDINGYETVDVTMDAAYLEPGDHVGNLTLNSNDPLNPVIDIPVDFHVGVVDVADSALNPDVLEAGDGVYGVQALIELPVGYDPADVVIGTVMLNGVIPAHPAAWSVDGDFNGNGIPDLQVKFCREDVEAILPHGEEVEVTVTGEVEDTIWFQCVNTIRVIAPVITSPNGGETYGTGQEIEIAWTNPEDRTVKNARLYFSMDDGLSWELIVGNYEGTNYFWTAPVDASETVKIRVFIYDNDGLLGSDVTDASFAVMYGVTAVENGVPTVYALKAAYPNPFNPQTKIAFDLVKPGKTKIAVYDVKGRLVTTLLDRQMEAGSHDVMWFGKDQAGRTMASGVYFYKINSEDFEAIKPMTLLK